MTLGKFKKQSNITSSSIMTENACAFISGSIIFLFLFSDATCLPGDSEVNSVVNTVLRTEPVEGKFCCQIMLLCALSEAA